LNANDTDKAMRKSIPTSADFDSDEIEFPVTHDHLAGQIIGNVNTGRIVLL
jgi:hypothetical protein